MDPIIIVEKIATENIESLEFSGQVLTLQIRIPVSRLEDINRNISYRAEVAQKIEEAILK